MMSTAGWQQRGVLGEGPQSLTTVACLREEPAAASCELRGASCGGGDGEGDSEGEGEAC